MTASPGAMSSRTYGGGGFGGHFSGEKQYAGNRIFVFSDSGISVPVGERLEAPSIVNLSDFSYFTIYFVAPQEVVMTVEWMVSLEGGFIQEKSLLLPSNSPDGTFIEGRVLGRKARIQMVNNGPDPLTEFHVAIYAQH